jgi:hypothetical protein
MEFAGDAAKLIVDKAPVKGEVAVLRHYLASHNSNAEHKKAVIERDTDLLTRDQEDIHWKDGTLRAATKEELKVWIDHNCFRRHPRRTARNIMDVRMVYKFKYVKREVAPKMFL